MTDPYAAMLAALPPRAEPPPAGPQCGCRLCLAAGRAVDDYPHPPPRPKATKTVKAATPEPAPEPADDADDIPF